MLHGIFQGQNPTKLLGAFTHKDLTGISFHGTGHDALVFGPGVGAWASSIALKVMVNEGGKYPDFMSKHVEPEFSNVRTLMKSTEWKMGIRTSSCSGLQRRNQFVIIHQLSAPSNKGGVHQFHLMATIAGMEGEFLGALKDIESNRSLEIQTALQYTRKFRVQPGGVPWCPFMCKTYHH